MKKIILIFLTILTASLSNPQKVLAYGGGGGFPPILGPLPSYKLECEYITRTIPVPRFNLNLSIKIPKCKVVKVTEENQNYSFGERFNNFISRVRNGGR